MIQSTKSVHDPLSLARYLTKVHLLKRSAPINYS